MRALVTGANGFVGRYLVERLRAEFGDVCALGGPCSDARGPQIDINDIESLRSVLHESQADVIFHLAAQTFVPAAIGDPLKTYGTNIIGTANLLQVVREYVRSTSRSPRFIFTSSAQVYDTTVPLTEPLPESHPLLPREPYAASKASAETIALAEARTFGLDIIIVRAFNQLGPGQSERFAAPAFATQIARIATGRASHMTVGNLEASRDFLDVRDAVEAYIALAKCGRSGEIYNVCSGKAISMRELLGSLIRIARTPVEVREDPLRMRPSDVPLLYGDNAKLVQTTGWTQRIALQKSLIDVYQDAMARLPAPA